LAKRKLELGRQSYKKASEPAPKEELEKAEITIEKAQQELKKLKEPLEDCEYKAPFSGTVLDSYIRPVDWEIHPEGIPLAQGNAILRLGDTREVKVRMEVFENEIGKVALEQKAIISSDSWKDHELTGRVTEVGSSAIPVGNLKKFPIVISLQDSGREFRPGSSVEVKLITGERKSVLAIPLKSLSEEEGKQKVTLLQNEKRSPTYITTGLDDGQYVEVIHGLSSGDKIIAPQAME
jgi:HlyD family secretion protein